jgi:hypothetical protein
VEDQPAQTQDTSNTDLQPYHLRYEHRQFQNKRLESIYQCKVRFHLSLMLLGPTVTTDYGKLVIYIYKINCCSKSNYEIGKWFTHNKNQESGNKEKCESSQIPKSSIDFRFIVCQYYQCSNCKWLVNQCKHPWRVIFLHNSNKAYN